MKALPLQTVLMLHLLGIVAGASQVFPLLSSITKVPLNMSIGSLDDQYKGCDPRMEAELKSPLNTDFASRGDYAGVWRKATSRWNGLPSSVTSNLQPEYGTAVVAYTDGSSGLYAEFNRAIREAGQAGKHGHAPFAFRSFHFLLTRALQVLKAAQPSCYTTYRGVKNIRFTITDHSKPIRFGQFASSSLSQDVAQGYGTDTFFTIMTCLGVRIENFSYITGEKEVLIPPYEKFHVTEFREEGGRTSITLRSDGTHSTYNCGAENAAGPRLISATVLVLLLLLGPLLVSGTLGSPDVF